MWAKGDDPSYHTKIIMKIVPSSFPGTAAHNVDTREPTPNLAPEDDTTVSATPSSASWRGRLMPARFRSMLSHARSRTIMNVEVSSVGNNKYRGGT